MQGVFSTVCAAERGGGSLLRLSNQNATTIPVGEITSTESHQLTRVNLAETQQQAMTDRHLILHEGEICTVHVTFDRA